MRGADEFGQEWWKNSAAGIRQLMKAAGKTNREFISPVLDEAISAAVEKLARVDLTDAVNTEKHEKLASYALVATVKKRTIEALPDEQREQGAKCFDALKERIFRDDMLKKHRRPDGRQFDQVRQITIETGVLPRVHGSTLFTRGETQAWSRSRWARRTTSSASNCWSRVRQQALHAALQLPAVQRRRSRFHARRGSSRKSDMALGERPAAMIPGEDSSLTRCT